MIGRVAPVILRCFVPRHRQGFRGGPATSFGALNGKTAIIAKGRIADLPPDNGVKHWTMTAEKTAQAHAR